MAVRKFPRMDLLEFKVEIPPSLVEELDTALQEHEITGWSLVEDVIVRRAWLVGIFSNAAEAKESWDALKAGHASLGALEPMKKTLVESEWRDSYKAHFKAWHFGRLHWVPVWDRGRYPVPADAEVLWLDPGLAFGTGNHETTRLCVERLISLEQRLGRERTSRFSVIDAGCGSGILALSAAKLGFGTIFGFDNDPEAVRVSQENAALNAVGNGVVFEVGDLVTGLAGRQADVVMANILADVLIRFAPNLVQSVTPGGSLVLSGILATENEAVRTAFGAIVPNWACDFAVMGEWSDVLLVRK
jgi:ribosomal protein L11 methyltransferase